MLNRTALKTILFHIKQQRPFFGQLEVLQSTNRAFSGLLNYSYYRQVSARLKHQEHEVSHGRRRIKDLKIVDNHV